MVRVFVFDNYPSETPEIYKLHDQIKEMVVDSLELHSYSSLPPVEQLNLFDVFILSDSNRQLSESGVLEQYYAVTEFIKQNKKPMLGISFGFHLIAHSFGVTVNQTSEAIKGYYMIELVARDPLFSEMKEKFLVYKDHQETINDLPINFSLIACSSQYPIEAYHHDTYPIYGVQFLPHVTDDKHPAGKKVMENFFSLAQLYT